MNPILSIVIATLDCAEELDTCLLSAKAVFNTLQHSEYEIIIKDGSINTSVYNVTQKYERCLSLKYYQRNDSGIYDAWNQAMDYCKGQWIFFMGADDTFVETFNFSSLASTLSKHKTPIISIPVMYVYGKKSNIERLDKVNFKNSVRHSNPFHHQGIFHLRETLKNFEFDRTFKICGDFDMLLKIINSDPDLILCCDTEPMVRMHSGGISSRISTNFLRLRERSIVRKNHKISTNYPVVACAYTAALVKKSLSLILNEETLIEAYFGVKITAIDYLHRIRTLVPQRSKTETSTTKENDN